MTHRILALLAALSLVPACLFDPDDHPGGPLEEELEDDADDDEGASGEDAGDVDEPNECREVEQPCDRGLDCCNYDPDFPPGSTQCVQIDQIAACTTICLEADDCATGCCASLEGITAYGACVDASICDEG